jgi:hypothetical protein
MDGSTATHVPQEIAAIRRATRPERRRRSISGPTKRRFLRPIDRARRLLVGPRMVEVRGAYVSLLLEGFRFFAQVPSVALLEARIGNVDGDGLVAVDVDAWYPHAAFVRALHVIQTRLSENAMFGVGLHMASAFPLTGHEPTVLAALYRLDRVHRESHRAPAGPIVRAVGSYRARPMGPTIVMRCDAPIPCDLDRGLLQGLVRRVSASAWVEHDDRAPCRTLGAQSCNYVVYA